MAFKINLFSAVVGCLGLVCLYGTAIQLLALLEPGENLSRFTGPALLPAGILAFSTPFWFHSLIAEVYTLHVFFTCGIIFLLLWWRQKDDLRFLFLAALVYGLSAGNHPTVALYLPAILVLFFCWNKKHTARNLTFSIVFFLLGLSVYTYLPLRSLAEPSMDWGNPETLSGFVYQVTDQKDAATHFSFLRETAGNDSASGGISAFSKVADGSARIGKIAVRLLEDLNTSLLPVSALGFLAGGVVCFRKNRPVFFFLLTVVALNSAFFTSWRRESFLPSYVVACLLTSIFLYTVLLKSSENPAIQNDSEPTRIRWRGIALAVLIFLIPWMAATRFYKVDRSGLYFGETLLKRVFLSLEERSLFVPGISWFNFFYHQDVTRLREDVSAVKAWDFLNPNPPSILTRKRYPDIKLPIVSKYRFDSREASRIYLMDFFRLNEQERPILIEQNEVFLTEFDLAGRVTPAKNILLKYSSDGTNGFGETSPDKAFNEFEDLLQEEGRKPGLLRDWGWTTKVSFYLVSFARYYHDRRLFPQERQALNLAHEALGHPERDYLPRMIDNLILDGKIEDARKQWKLMLKQFPNHYWTYLGKGLLLRAEKNFEESLLAIQKAVELNPTHFRMRLELATAYRLTGDIDSEKRAFKETLERARNLTEIKFLRQRMTH
ncbi:hypothetical protein UR09_00425 [Candidatus Nitromaritima sp. SCGC AAA799-A02]|nr:hypothetical protein UR09_00425 [Candidatus Nitromaritima sp. SCGC AAA799-A02]